MNIKNLYIIIAIFCFYNIGFAQTNTDSLFNAAIENAQKKEYLLAISNAEKVLELHPERYDVMIFIANVYGWQQNFEQSKKYLNQAYELQANNYELYDSWLNILLWNKEYEELLKIADIAEQNKYSRHYNLALKKLITNQKLGKFDEGIKLANQNPGYLDSIAFQSIYNNITVLNKKNYISGFYSMNYIDNPYTSYQHLAYLEYQRKINKNTLIVRTNYANRFNLEDFQFEADYYQSIKKAQYLYLNYGIGVSNNLFPKQRVGIEYYFPLVNSFEASLGGRYLLFNTSDVYIATMHLGKYIGNSFLSIRPYYTFENNGNASSLVFDYRYYNNNAIAYWGVELTYGNSPDDPNITLQNGDILHLDAYKVKLEKNILLSNSQELKIAAGYSYEEYIKSNYRNRYIVEFTFKQRF